MFNPATLHAEVSFKAVRSSGRGGQHVNKVSTAVELYFNVKKSSLLNEEQKQLILSRLANRISKDGELIMTSQTERSQFANKKKVMSRFNELIAQSLKKQKKRIPSKVSESQKQKRLDQKKRQAEKKWNRSSAIDL